MSKSHQFLLFKYFWHLAKNISNNFASSSFSSLLKPDWTAAFTSVSKAELFTRTFPANSTLDDSGHIPPIYAPSESVMPVIKIPHNGVLLSSKTVLPC